MKQEVCLALGFFDSVHCGHREIIKRLKSKAAVLGIEPVVSTFTDNFFKEKANDALVYTFYERETIFSRLGIKKILLFEFDDAFKRKTPYEFLDYLKQKYLIRIIFCGEDYRFGAERSGDINILGNFCKENSIELEIVNSICLDGERVSSSKIKKFIMAGEIETANKMLCDNFFIMGEVQRGRGEGKSNQAPTANLLYSDAKLMPKNGVYATKTFAFNRFWDSVTNIGTKPTYDDYFFGVETFLDGFSGNLYGEEIKIVFYKYLREIKKFDNKNDLGKQIKLDMLASKRVIQSSDNE